jgi:hypothetical protein
MLEVQQAKILSNVTGFGANGQSNRPIATSAEMDEWDWDPFILGLLAANTLGVWYLLMKRRE